MSIFLGVVIFALIWWWASSRSSSKAAPPTGLPITLYVTVEEAQTVAPPMPKGRVANIARDHIESDKTNGQEKADKALAGMAFFIVYRDTKGDVTERRITIRKIVNKGEDLYISAFCHERQAQRSFYSSRIESLTDLATGEIVENATSYLQELQEANGFGKPAAVLPEKNESENLYPLVEFDPLGKAIEDFQSEVIALIFMARADGHMVKSERKVIFEFVKQRLPEGKFFDEEIDDYLARMYPDKDLFKEVLGDVLKLDVARRERLVQSLEAVMEADGKIKEGETSMSKTFRDALVKKDFSLKAC